MTEAIALIKAFADIGTPVALIAIGVWFFIQRFWPWWTTRDSETRAARESADIRESERESAHATALIAISEAIKRLSDAVQNCPLKG